MLFLQGNSLKEKKLKTIDSNVKFEPIIRSRSWGKTYTKSPKKRKRYEDKRVAKISERYKEDEKDDGGY